MGKKRMRKRYEASFKARVALAALKDDKTLSEVAEKFDVHASQITQWKTQLSEAATEVFLTLGEKREAAGPSMKDMQAKLGLLALENDVLVRVP